MSLQTIARRYATALADVVTERAEAKEVHAELKGWEEMLVQSPQLREVFANPTISYDQKRRVLSELIARTKVRPTTANFLQLLLKNHRLTELAEINRRLELVLDERAGIVAADVLTARPISDDIRQTIRGKLRGLTGKEVRVNFQTDSDIIGGLVTRIGSTVYDGSIRTQLELLSAKLAHS
ncbi:MAG TPA: ATP synthase F1 subunit delta [Pyrinomonadaceae bacterium]|nr:ATP synthase F1 subunit delta [Pyrinomonadaceae bacterium]